MGRISSVDLLNDFAIDIAKSYFEILSLPTV